MCLPFYWASLSRSGAAATAVSSAGTDFGMACRMASITREFQDIQETAIIAAISFSKIRRNYKVLTQATNLVKRGGGCTTMFHGPQIACRSIRP